MLINSFLGFISFSPAGDDDGSGGTGGNPPKPETVTREAYERAVGESKAEREKRKAMETELSEYKRKEAEAAEADALKRGEFDKLLQAERDKAAKIVADLEAERGVTAAMREKQLYIDRSTAFVDALGMPIEKRFWDLVDVSKIELTSDGNVDKASAVKYANDFKTQFADILAKSGATNFPNGKPQGGGSVGFHEAKTLKEKHEALPDAVEKRMRELGLPK